jgi:hypothetical protein
MTKIISDWKIRRLEDLKIKGFKVKNGTLEHKKPEFLRF